MYSNLNTTVELFVRFFLNFGYEFQIWQFWDSNRRYSNFLELFWTNSKKLNIRYTDLFIIKSREKKSALNDTNYGAKTKSQKCAAAAIDVFDFCTCPSQVQSPHTVDLTIFFHSVSSVCTMQLRCNWKHMHTLHTHTPRIHFALQTCCNYVWHVTADKIDITILLFPSILLRLCIKQREGNSTLE